MTEQDIKVLIRHGGYWRPIWPTYKTLLKIW